jgi:hypothetical protein
LFPGIWIFDENGAPKQNCPLPLPADQGKGAAGKQNSNGYRDTDFDLMRTSHESTASNIV